MYIYIYIYLKIRELADKGVINHPSTIKLSVKSMYSEREGGRRQGIGREERKTRESRMFSLLYY